METAVSLSSVLSRAVVSGVSLCRGVSYTTRGVASSLLTQ